MTVIQHYSVNVNDVFVSSYTLDVTNIYLSLKLVRPCFKLAKQNFTVYAMVQNLNAQHITCLLEANTSLILIIVHSHIVFFPFSQKPFVSIISNNSIRFAAVLPLWREKWSSFATQILFLMYIEITLHWMCVCVIIYKSTFLFCFRTWTFNF